MRRATKARHFLSESILNPNPLWKQRQTERKLTKKGLGLTLFSSACFDRRAQGLRVHQM